MSESIDERYQQFMTVPIGKYIGTTTLVYDMHAEIARLNELLRGVGANRYWEGRWRDADAEIARLRADLAKASSGI